LGSAPPYNARFLGPTRLSPSPKRSLDRFSLFTGLTNVSNRQTDRHADRQDGTPCVAVSLFRYLMLRCSEIIKSRIWWTTINDHIYILLAVTFLYTHSALCISFYGNRSLSVNKSRALFSVKSWRKMPHGLRVCCRSRESGKHLFAEHQTTKV